MSSVRRTKKPLQPVSVTGRFLKRPLCCCELLPQGSPGVLEIDHTPYLCSYVSELPPEDEPIIYGYQITKADGAVYHIDAATRWGQWQCDCPDAVYRGERPGGCRHVAALRQALAKIATLNLERDPDPADEPVLRTLAEGGAA